MEWEVTSGERVSNSVKQNFHGVKQTKGIGGLGNEGCKFKVELEMPYFTQ